MGAGFTGPPPYSPDLAPCDFGLFPQLKEKLHGKRFWNLRALQEGVEEVMCSFKQPFFENLFVDLVTCWKKCIAADGDYFEGEHIHVESEDFGQDSESSSDESE